jgi:hypothetical protein
MREATRWRKWWRSQAAVLSLVLILALASCATNDDEGDTPTAPDGRTPTQAPARPTPTVAATLPPATLSAANGNTISDGVCRALVPEGWVDDGTGRGTTSGGHRFVLFGGRVRNDAEWNAATDIVATPTAGKTVASIERTVDSIHVVYGDDRGFEFRKRFGDRYCDFSVASNSRSISPEERAFWSAVIGSIEPAQE